MRKRLLLAAVAACVAAVLSLAGSASALAVTSVSPPLNVTNSHFAGNEESLGMDPAGTLLASAWNDWH